MDPFGVMVLASVTAIGGGTIRDMALGATPVFWIKDTNYLWVIMITCALTMLLVRRPKRLAWWILPVCDAIGLAVFVGIGVEKALIYQDSALIAIIMGVITGCGGGIIRDVAPEKFLWCCAVKCTQPPVLSVAFSTLPHWRWATAARPLCSLAFFPRS